MNERHGLPVDISTDILCPSLFLKQFFYIVMRSAQYEDLRALGHNPMIGMFLSVDRSAVWILAYFFHLRNNILFSEIP